MKIKYYVAFLFMSFVSLICIDPHICKYHFAPVSRISFKIYLAVDLLLKNSFYFLILNCVSFNVSSFL